MPLSIVFMMLGEGWLLKGLGLKVSGGLSRVGVLVSWLPTQSIVGMLVESRLLSIVGLMRDVMLNSVNEELRG